MHAFARQSQQTPSVPCEDSFPARSYDPIKDTNDKSGASGMTADEVLMDFDSFLEVITRVSFRLLDASLRQTPSALRSCVAIAQHAR